MKVLYDSDVFSNQTFGGISHYFVELMNHLPSPWDYDFSVVACENAYIPELKRRKRVIPLRHFPDHRKLYHFINGFADRRHLCRGDYDVFHPTGFLPYFENLNRKPYVVTVHDMTHHHLLGGKRDRMAECIDRVTLGASRIIAISQATKDDILRFYDIDENRIDVIHHGFNPVTGSTAPLPGLPKDYILFVGHRAGYKNFDNLLEAFAILSRSDSDLSLVCTGKGFSRAETEKIRSLRLEGKVVSRFIAQRDMNALYANARCFVFPSRLEGFGMPILESFAAGCPVALSRASCLPEIAGIGGRYFNPDEPDDIALQVSRIIYDPAVRRNLVRAGNARLADFSWEKTARLTADTYTKALR